MISLFCTFTADTMPNDTQSSGKINDNESNNSKGRHCSGKESTTSCSATSDSSGLRRSTREASLKRKIIPSPPCTRKSGRLDKQTPTSPTVNRKSERIEKKGMPSPLRRSERCKKLSSSSSSGSKISDRSLSSTDTEQKKGKKERSVKMLTLETKVGRREREDVESAPVKKKRMDARAYRALFKTQPKKVVAAGNWIFFSPSSSVFSLLTQSSKVTLFLGSKRIPCRTTIL